MSVCSKVSVVDRHVARFYPDHHHWYEKCNRNCQPLTRRWV